jgi:Tol biopolymer transport system component
MKFCVISKIIVLLIGFSAAILVGAGSAKADFIWGTPTNLGPVVNTGSADARPDISADGLSVYFNSNRSGGYGNHDIYVTTRATKDDDWGPPINLGPNVNSSLTDNEPDISADGLTLYFSSGGDIWVATRTTTEDGWGPRVKLGPTVNSLGGNYGPSISADGLELFFTSDRPGGYGDSDLWVTTRETTQDEWGEPVNLGSTINSSVQDQSPSISADGLMLFFDCGPDGSNDWDLWVTKRATKSDPWGEPVNLGPAVNSSSWECAPSISDDGSTLVFWSSRPGGSGSSDLWQVSIEPVVDFNSDGIVDSVDMCIMIDHWGENYSLCDIGPSPLGDGIVDVQDLIVLAEHLFEEVPLPGLIAHWKFDETEGFEAQNSVGLQNGFLFGDPIWHPAGGKKDGALELDGIDDYIIAVSALNPADGAFSVFAWIKGGAPGQVIISQVDGTGTGETWLGIDTLEGNLMTGLVPPSGRTPSTPLVSESMITDGDWHHIGFVWDGSYRALYVDGTIAATDIEVLGQLEFSNGGLYIGTSKTLEAGTFFSGLIDDVRIYDVALSAEQIASLAQ